MVAGGGLDPRFSVQPTQGKSNVERVRLSLQFILAKDETFTLESEDDAFVWSKTNVDPDIEFVVAGHTHLERAIQRSSGGYFNSGTWASLIRLSEQQLSEEAELTHTVPTVVSIVAPSSRAPAVGQLHLAVNDAEHEGQVRLTRRNDTRSEARG